MRRGASKSFRIIVNFLAGGNAGMAVVGCAVALNRVEFNARCHAEGGEKIGGDHAAGAVRVLGAGVAGGARPYTRKCTSRKNSLGAP